MLSLQAWRKPAGSWHFLDNLEQRAESLPFHCLDTLCLAHRWMVSHILLSQEEVDFYCTLKSTIPLIFLLYLLSYKSTKPRLADLNPNELAATPSDFRCYWTCLTGYPVMETPPASSFARCLPAAERRDYKAQSDSFCKSEGRGGALHLAVLP